MAVFSKFSKKVFFIFYMLNLGKCYFSCMVPSHYIGHTKLYFNLLRCLKAALIYISLMMWVSAVQKSWCCVFICLCSEEVSRHGFTVIVDMRGSKWDSIKPLLKILQESFPSCIHVALIIKPDNFWQKQRTNFGSSKFEFEVRTLSIVNLHLTMWKWIRSSVSGRNNNYFLKSVVWDYRNLSGKYIQEKTQSIFYWNIPYWWCESRAVKITSDLFH